MSDNKITIEIDGVNFEDYLSGNVSRRMDEFCGTFNFNTTKDQSEEYNITEQSYCNIYVNGKKAMTGVIDNISPSEDPSSSTISISGRDITCDIVDSSLPSSISLSGEFTLVTVIEKVLKALGLDDKIKVINQVENLRSFTSKDIVSSEVDKNAYDFINDYAQKVSAILNTDEDGNIVITKAGVKSVPDILLNTTDPIGSDQNNILSSSSGYDYSKRFYKYIVVSQNNATTEKKQISVESVSQKGIAYDEEVRTSRVLVIKANNSCNSETCQEIATLEANVRRANSLKYNCKVAGYELNSGELYSVNTLISVVDDDNYINSQLLIKSVDFDFGDGSTTSMEFGYMDAYTLQANLDEIDARTSQTKDNKKAKGKKG